MSLRNMKRLFRALRPRPIAALLAIHLAMTGTGIPCLLVCTAAEAREVREHATCQESKAANHHDSCPDDSPCVKDPSPALAAHAEPPLSPDAAAALPVFVALRTTPLSACVLALRTMPDRSPPISPGFVVLRI
jgi:hypothetical protein